MNRIDRAFAAGRPVLVGYLPIGDPAMPSDLAERYIQAGVDVLECGVAVRDPVLDGAVVRDSMARTLAAGVDAAASARLLSDLRRELPEAALAVMTYPEHDEETLLTLGSLANGLLMPVPARRFAGLAERLATRGSHLLHFLAQDADRDDDAAAASARGYVMVQAAPGVTGVRTGAPTDLAARIAGLRERGVVAPIAAGFGIGTPERVRATLAMGADAAVVGSALVSAALRGGTAVDELAAECAEAAHG